MENLWSTIKCNVGKRKLSNMNELEPFFGEEFRNMDIDTVNNCIISMKIRCLSFIDCDGERMKY